MNNRRKQERREASDFEENNTQPMNRAHMDCERDCLGKSRRIKMLESLIGRSFEKMINASTEMNLCLFDGLIAEIDQMFKGAKNE